MTGSVPPFLTIAQAGRLIAAKRLSPVELVKRLLARIEATDPRLNAFLLVTERQALTAARAAERAVMAGRKGPLLGIPLGRATTYSDIAMKLGKPTAARAVGAAVGKNPVSFVVPCHRVMGKSGDLTGYHWGLTRKRAMLGWEAGRVEAA